MKSKLLGDQSLGRDIVVSFQSLTTSDSSPSFVAHCSGSAVPLIKAKPASAAAVTGTVPLRSLVRLR